MEKDARLGAQPLEGDAHDVGGAGEPRRAVADDAFRLERALAQPAVEQREVLAAVIALVVLDADENAVSERRDAFARAVGHAGHRLGEMNRRVGRVADAEEEDGWSSSSDIAGMTSVPRGPSALRRAEITPAGPPSTGPTTLNDVCTMTVDASRSPSAPSCSTTARCPTGSRRAALVSAMRRR
jgi:hypothetical protein